MASVKNWLLLGAAVSVMFVGAPIASAQYYGPYYGPYYGDDYWFDYDYDLYDYGYDYRWRDPELGVDEVLDDPQAEWEYETFGNEWEIESVYGEVEFEADWDLRNATREQIREAIRAELRRPGSWDWEPLQGEWEYETNTGNEVEYDPTPDY